jgi:hypothetical protein
LQDNDRGVPVDYCRAFGPAHIHADQLAFNHRRLPGDLI